MPDSSHLPIEFFQAREADLLGVLGDLVSRETPSDDPATLTGFSGWLAAELIEIGAEIKIHISQAPWTHIQATWGAGLSGVLLLTHFDTVHPLGSLATMPWKVGSGRALGPGVFDMKASIAMAITAISALRDSGLLPPGRLTLLATSDEETGSHSSRDLIIRLAQEHGVVFCLEPPLSDGSLKTWRKGVGAFQLRARGRASHAGVIPQSGVSAIQEMAHQIQAILELASPDLGTTLNIGVIRGGTRANVVPDTCIIQIDVRFLEAGEQERIDKELRSLVPVLPGASLEISGEWNRPPMPRTPLVAHTYRWARQIAARLGLDLGEGGTGGASDANFVAPLGLPLLDGLGAPGGDAHSPSEWVSVPSLAPRTALLAALIQSALQEPPGSP